MINRGRVYLSSLEEKHIDRYIQFSADPELIDTMGWKPFSTGETERFLKTVQVLTLPYCGVSKLKIFSVLKTADDEAIGFVSIKGINETIAAGEIGIAIMEKAYRDQGYGTEALQIATQYAFYKLNLTLLGLTVFLSNRRAIRAYEKLGFRKKEILKDSWQMPDGQYRDMWYMELAHEQLTHPLP